MFRDSVTRYTYPYESEYICVMCTLTTPGSDEEEESDGEEAEVVEGEAGTPEGGSGADETETTSTSRPEAPSVTSSAWKSDQIEDAAAQYERAKLRIGVCALAL